jgi:hypothetical protein
MDFGNISTNIIKKGLVFNMDAANRASTIPSTSTTKTLNTVDLSQSGSIVTDATWTNSTLTPSFDFDGIDGYIEITKISNLQITNNFTYGVWVKTPGGAGSNLEGTFIANQFAWQSSGYTIGTYSSKIQVFGSDGSSAHYDANTMRGIGDNNITDNQWHYIAVTFASGVTKVYIDGSLPTDGSGEFTSGATSISYDNSTIFRIGQAATSFNYDHVGQIGPVHIYNRVLSASEVLFNYNSLKSRFGL